MLGVTLVAYEGGPEFAATSGTDATVQQAAWSDSRMSQNLVAHYQSWASYGGLVLNWLIAVGDKTYGFAGPSLSEQSTPKLAGVAQIAAASKYPVTFGYTLGAPRRAGEASLTSRGNGPGTAGSRTIAVNDPNQDLWLGFVYNASDSASRTVTLTFPSGSGTVKVYVDGAQVGTQAVGPGTYAFGAGTLATGVHSVIVAAAAGSFELSTILVQ